MVHWRVGLLPLAMSNLSMMGIGSMERLGGESATRETVGVVEMFHKRLL